MESSSPRFPFESGLNSEPDFRNPRRRRVSGRAGRVAARGNTSEERVVTAPDRHQPEQPDQAERQERSRDLLAKLMSVREPLGSNEERSPQNPVHAESGTKDWRESYKQTDERDDQTRRVVDGTETVTPDTAQPEQEHDEIPQVSKLNEFGYQEPVQPFTHPEQRNTETYEPLPQQEIGADDIGGGEFVLHLNDGEQPEEPSSEEHFIPLHEQAQHAEHQDEDLPQDALDFPGAPRPQYEQQPEQQHTAADEHIPRPTVENPLAPLNEATPYTAEASAAPLSAQQENTEQRWMSQLPPEMVAAARRHTYETPLTDAYSDALATSVATGSRYAATGYGNQVVTTQREINRAVQQANTEGVMRGLITGGVIVGAYEHFKHKRREKHREKQLQQRSKQLEQARSEYRFATAEQAQKQSATEQRLQQVQTELMRPARPTTAQPERYPVQSQQMPNRYEQRPSPTDPEQIPGNQPRERQPAGDSRIEVPNGHRLSTEGTFIAELDKNGRVVETPAFTYGKEYYRERAQENTPLTQRMVATGEVALVAAAVAGDKAKPQDDATGTARRDSAGVGAAIDLGSAASIPNATTQGAPSAAHKQQAAADPGAQTNAQSTQTQQPEKPLWPWLIALAAVVICCIWLI